MINPNRLPPLAFVVSFAVLAFAACGETEGSVVVIDVALEAGGTPASFTTDTGWTVELEEARVALGPFYAFAPRKEGDAVAMLREFLLPVARAHGGTDPLNGRRVRAEWLRQVAFDAMSDETVELGAIEAESGVVETVSVTLNPPDAANTSSTNGHHLYARGVATRDDVVVPFEGGLDIPDEGLSRRVENIPLDTFLDAGGRWVLTVDASAWFEGAQFDRLTEQEDGVYLITPESQVRGAWLLAARNTRAYSARFDLEESNE
ncbi:MAG: hypothetical protein AAGF92_01825 [Myxococcota bacterium]